MKSILQELEINLNSAPVVVGFGASAQGKSTFSAYLVKELHDAGKHISVITDDSEELWINRLRNIGCKSSDAKIIFKQLLLSKTKDLLNFITKQKENMPFINCLVLDVSIIGFDKTGLQEIIRFVKSNEMFMFMTSYKRKEEEEDNLFKSLGGLNSTLDKLMLSDVAISIGKKESVRLSFWQRLLNIFRPIFGFEKYKPMNTQITVHKNRYSKVTHNFDYQLDFDKINKKNTQ